MERPRILIVSDDPQFSFSLANVWTSEPRPAFSMVTSDGLGSLAAEDFDLAVVGSCRPDPASPVAPLGRRGLPILQIAACEEAKLPGAIQIPEIEQWAELAKTVAALVIDCARWRRQAEELAAAHAQLECQAALGRYMLDMRLNLNDALTSLLGNSELILAAQETVSSHLREQLETIRNMGMRMHEILQRFSSLEKEMRLMAEHSPRKAARASQGA